jgi:hypothetical protein
MSKVVKWGEGVLWVRRKIVRDGSDVKEQSRTGSRALSVQPKIS